MGERRNRVELGSLVTVDGRGLDQNIFLSAATKGHTDRRMEAFRGVLEECQLMDVGYSGVWFTWEMGNLPKTNVRERLDRRVANVEWMSMFPSTMIQHIPHSFLDHYLLLIRTELGTNELASRRLRFEAW
ncbi:hypothetical protein Gogos_020747 [Gossypium gossypioides]|uniref:Endonuclease/exonuclease/phosphatase domain-containing protein n=1 Tax=Gossypium gossypioides TaxID=34282 RepID=A0A7J9CZH0_GOSGO|nr:hypothetical protein [Gossypium gossypioides]